MKITISGQAKGSKNNVLMTRHGRRYPKPNFAAWRDYAILEVKGQNVLMEPISRPVDVIIHYFPEDRRRRDVPGIIDGIWHVLERAGVVKDDALLGGFGKSVIFYNMGVSEKPRVVLEIG